MGHDFRGGREKEKNQFGGFLQVFFLSLSLFVLVIVRGVPSHPLPTDDRQGYQPSFYTEEPTTRPISPEYQQADLLVACRTKTRFFSSRYSFRLSMPLYCNARPCQLVSLLVENQRTERTAFVFSPRIKQRRGREGISVNNCEWGHAVAVFFSRICTETGFLPLHAAAYLPVRGGMTPFLLRRTYSPHELRWSHPGTGSLTARETTLERSASRYGCE